MQLVSQELAMLRSQICGLSCTLHRHNNSTDCLYRTPARRQLISTTITLSELSQVPPPIPYPAVRNNNWIHDSVCTRTEL